jgi:hypothetical protein
MFFQDRRKPVHPGILHSSNSIDNPGLLHSSSSIDNPISNNFIELNNLNHPLAYTHTRSTDFGSLDSSDTFLSCNTHPFPSQGSLAGLEALAAQGSMAPNGSINNTLYVNPFDPTKSGGNVAPRVGGGIPGPDHRRRKEPSINNSGGRNNGYNRRSSNNNNNGSINGNNGCSVSPSPKGSPQRRVRIAARSRSSDLSDFDLMERETGVEDIQPKHLRSRLSQVKYIQIISFSNKFC